MTMMFEFPAGLSDKYEPKRLKDFIGIDKPLATMKAFIKRPYPSAWFFIGASGLGKTTLGMALAREGNAELHLVPSQKCDAAAVDEVTRRCWTGAFNFFGDRKGKPADFHLVLVDEADRMSMAAQLQFHSKLDATAMPPNTVFIFTANSATNLQDSFLSRCRCLVFERESMKKALPAFLVKVYKSECRLTLPLAQATKIAEQSNWNVRDALMELEVSLLARAA